MQLTSFQDSDDLLRSDDYVPPELLGLREPVTRERFIEFCSLNRKLRLELTSTGELIIMPFLGLESGRRNADLTCQLVTWAQTNGTGVYFASCTVFELPNGAWRMPDVSWVKREKWISLTKQEQEGLGSLCPDFVVEVRCPDERLPPLRAKMVEYMENSVSLGWLIDPYTRRVYVYQPNQELVILENPKTVSGDPLLSGFTLDVTELW